MKGFLFAGKNYEYFFHPYNSTEYNERIVEVPIRYTPRTYESGKKITWRHGVIMLWTITKWRVLPLP